MNELQWEYTIDPYGEEPIILINKHIGFDPIDGEGIMGDIFEREICTLDKMGKKCINIYINSPGGSVDAGFSIFNSILRCETPTVCHNTGLAASIAGVIMQAADKRKVYDYSITMIHNPAKSGADLTPEQDKVLKIYKDSLMIMLRKHSNISFDSLNSIMNAETWMNANTAVKEGFADELVFTKEVVEDLTAFEDITQEMVTNSWRTYNTILNKIVNKNKNNKMITKLQTVLDLAGENAPEEEIVNAFKEAYPTFFKPFEVIKDETSFSPNMDNDEDVTDATSEEVSNEIVDEVVNDSEVIDYKAEYMKMKAEMECMTNSKINDKINDGIKLGKISKEASNEWTELFKSNYTAAEKVLNSLTVNKKAENDLSKIIDKTVDKAVVKNKIAEIQGKTITNSLEDMDWMKELFKK